MKSETSAARERVWPLLSHGGWKTSGELGCGFRLKGSGPALHEMQGLLEAGKVLVTDVPGSGRAMYHRTTSMTRRLYPDAASIAFQDLPYTLKRSLINKMLRSRHDWEIDPDIAVWARVMTRFEEHLCSIGLNDVRPRPDDHLIFPCGWLPAYDSFANPGNPRNKEYTFQVDFVEVIPGRLARLSPDGAWGYEDDDRQCSIELGEEAVLRMKSVATARLGRKNLQAVDCPPRDAIVDETVKRLQAGAAKWDPLIPFTPIVINPSFQLLTDARKDEEERRKKETA